jgi:hypothetical protein
MRSVISGLVLVLTYDLLAANSHAELVEWGDSGEYFHDTETGLYWWDPAEFEGWTRSEIESFLQSDVHWNWATSDQIDALVGKSSQGGVPPG